MKRGYTVAATVQFISDQKVRANCLKGHEEPTGAMTCTEDRTQTGLSKTTHCVPEMRFVCDKPKAEAQ